jgi:NAD(P)H-dependent FMN reductase
MGFHSTTLMSKRRRGYTSERVSALKEAIVAADGLLLAMLEYNNSMSMQVRDDF